MVIRRLILLLAAVLGPLNLASHANPWNGKVVFQGFWWDCENQNYPGDWYTYLAKLSPRLKEMGFDGIWTPPPCKGKSGGFSMGYDIFDHYDIGNKDQKGTVPTRFGNQDSFLRFVAVAHANGLEVYPDIVLNHCEGGEEDPGIPSNIGEKHRKFSYQGFGGENMGRWPKSWLDFHPNPDHWENFGDSTGEFGFGRDICFRDPCGPAGTSHVHYMRDKAREWFVWLKKQTGVDGFRFDMVKHYPAEIVEDLLFNAMGEGKEYFAVGEYVGSADEVDRWADAARNRSGTFDYPFRGALVGIVRSNGYFDMGSLPNYQQKNRFKTVPFVNNHDTYKGAFWDSGNSGSLEHDDNDGDPAQHGSELAPSIDPDDPRADVAYAAAFAVDGSPMVFYDDFFINYLDSRKKANPDQHPVRDYLANLVWCHQKLNFKDGAYKVRFQNSPDLLVIERSGKAIIGLNDNGVQTLKAWVQTDFGNNVKLHDYSGSTQNELWTNNDGWVEVTVPPMSYCVLGRDGIGGGFSPAVRRTTQEFQFDDDLGDSRQQSLQYGGKLVGADFRTAGAIWAAKDSVVKIWLYGAESRPVELRVDKPDSAGAKTTNEGQENASAISGPTSPLYFEFTARSEGYYQLRAKLADPAAIPVRGFLKVEYQAPASSTLF